MNFIVNDIKRLQNVTREYHAASEECLELLNRVMAQGTPATTNQGAEIESLTNQISYYETAIMKELNAFAEIEDFQGEFIVKALNKYVYLKPIKNSKTVAKFELQLTNAFKATGFKTIEEADEQVKAIQYAIFRNYIHGIGSNKKGVA